MKRVKHVVTQKNRHATHHDIEPETKRRDKLSNCKKWTAVLLVLVFIVYLILFPLALPRLYSEQTTHALRSNNSIAHERLNYWMDITKKKALWKGDVVVGEGNPHRFHRIFVVLSHCNKELGWFKYFTKGFPIHNITILSKCNANVEEFSSSFPDFTVIRLPNVGREGHSYAHWMSNSISSSSLKDNDVVVFMKDNQFIHQKANPRSLKEILRITSVYGFGCWLEPTGDEFSGEDMSFYHNTEALLDFKMGFYVRADPESMVHFVSHFDNLGQWLHFIGSTLPEPLTPVCYGGVFAVEASRIKKWDSEFWKRVEESVSRADHLEEGHFLERSWAGLLSDPLNDENSKVVQEYATGLLDRDLSYRGALFRELH